MTILWCGGEEIDFPVRGASMTTWTTATYFRANLARGAFGGLPSSHQTAASPILTPFSSAWLTAMVHQMHLSANTPDLGLAKSGTNAWIGVGSGSTNKKLALLKYDGTTVTRLAESSGSFNLYFELHRIDLQIVSYAASGQARVYLDGVQVIDYSGDLTVLSQTTIDQVLLHCWDGSSAGGAYISEVILADEDTRQMELAVLYPNAAGDANAWTGTYLNIDEATLSDADVVSSASAAQAAQFNLSSHDPAFRVRAVKMAARASGVAGESVQLGIKTNGTVYLNSAVALDSNWVSIERLDLVNPNTSSEFTPSELAALQVALLSS